MKTSFLPGNALLHFLVYPLLLFFITISGCRKQDSAIPIIPSSKLKVIATFPEHEQAGSAFDGNISAALDSRIDTANFQASIIITQNEAVVKGTVMVQDSTVTFLPEAELLPSVTYAATLTVSKKAGGIVVTYKWNFTTKGPDEFLMTKRSNAVTDFDRDGSRMMQIGQHIYSFGGWNVPEKSHNDVYRSSGDLSTWEKLPDAPWHGRHVFGIAQIKDFTYIIGGDNLQSTFDVWRTADGVNWMQLATNILDNRIYYGCTAHKGYLYVVGGAGHNDVWRSQDGIKWEQVTSYVPFLNGENFAGSLTSFAGRLWMVCGGGSGGGTGVARKEVWSSADGKEWKQEKDFGGSGRYYTDVCVWDNKLWVVGGYSDSEGNIKSIWYMKPDGTWKEFETPNEYVGRHATGVAVYNNKLAITCGNYQNDGWAIEKIK